MLDMTVNLGHIIQLVAFVMVGVGGFYAVKGQVSAIKIDMKHLQDKQESLALAMQQLSAILTQVAVQDVRINHIQQQVEELKHGRGFIKKPTMLKDD